MTSGERDNGRNSNADQAVRERRSCFHASTPFIDEQTFEATTEILGIGSDEAKRRDVARFIIRLAQEGDRLDVAALRDRAVAALGGVAYCALFGIPQPSNLRSELTDERWILHDGEAGAL